MTATITAQIGTTDWQLTGIGHNGGTCEHCDRNLTHVYAVRNAQTGHNMTVGRSCCKKVTGWTLAAKEADRILAYAEKLARREAAWIEFTAEQPALAAAMDDAIAREIRNAYQMKSDVCEINSAAGREAFASRWVAFLNS